MSFILFLLKTVMDFSLHPIEATRDYKAVLRFASRCVLWGVTAEDVKDLKHPDDVKNYLPGGDKDYEEYLWYKQHHQSKNLPTQPSTSGKTQ